MVVEPAVLDALADLPEHWVYSEFWGRGNLEYLLKPDGQTRAYKAIHKWRDDNPGDPGPYVVNAHRGFGKTALEIILAWEECLKYPGWTARYATPDIKQGEDILAEVLADFLLGACPLWLRPHKRDNTYTFRNPKWNDSEATSRFILVGCKEHADGQRGKRSNFVGMDEIRDIRRPRYVVEDVFASHFITKERPFFLICSTPPRTTGHYMIKNLIPYAKSRGAYIEIKGSENTDFTDEDREKILKVLMIESHKEVEDTPAYQREIECELVADRTVLACPEFYASEHTITSYTPPSHFWPVTGVDFGHIDYNVALCGCCDFYRSALIITDEFVKNSIATSELAIGLKAAEFRAWGSEEDLKHMPQRWADNDAQLIYDLSRDYDVSIAPVRKDWKGGKWAALSALRTAIDNGRVLIHTDCVNLIFQLENAEINEQRTDFVKADYAADQDPSSPILGHADALMALVYLWWMCNALCTTDPFPPRDIEGGEFVSPRFGPLDKLPDARITEDSRHITGALFGDWRRRFQDE